MDYSTSYPEYNLIEVEVKIIRFLDDCDKEEDVIVNVYPFYDEKEIEEAIRDQHNYKLIEFELLNN